MGIREDFLINMITEALGFEEFNIEKLKDTVESLKYGENRRFIIVTKDGKTIRLKMGGRNDGYSYEDTCNTE